MEIKCYLYVYPVRKRKEPIASSRYSKYVNVIGDFLSEWNKVSQKKFSLFFKHPFIVGR